MPVSPTTAQANHRGRRARNPLQIPFSGWKDIARRVAAEFTADRVSLIAAGAAFFLLLALFPALTAFVSIYGFVSDPITIADHIAMLGGFLPSAGIDIIKEQLLTLASKDSATLSIGFLGGLAVALWSANNGIKTLFEAMNVAYDETEKRGFIKLNLVSLAFTLAAILIGTLLLVTVGVVPAALKIAGLGSHTEWIIAVARWPVLFAACSLGIGAIYRYGPSRSHAKWRWIVLGSVVAALLWIVGSILFSWYIQNFANYDKTYGSLGAVIGLMMWTWLSLVILLMGAELNSEIEHQTKIDSTVGPEAPMGERGAVMADTVGRSYGGSEPVTGEAAAQRNTEETKRRGALGALLLLGTLSLVISSTTKANVKQPVAKKRGAQ